MTNDELAEAIAYAFNCCDKTYIGGEITRNSEVGKMMLVQLRLLLELQVVRAHGSSNPLFTRTQGN